MNFKLASQTKHHLKRIECVHLHVLHAGFAGLAATQGNEEFQNKYLVLFEYSKMCALPHCSPLKWIGRRKKLTHDDYDNDEYETETSTANFSNLFDALNTTITPLIILDNGEQIKYELNIWYLYFMRGACSGAPRCICF